MAQVALLHTEMNSGFRFNPKIGMNSAEENIHIYIYTQINKEKDLYLIKII